MEAGKEQPVRPVVSSLSGVTRRRFIATSAAAAAGSWLAPSLAAGAFVQGKQELKIALVGCGGRGRGAIKDAISAGEHSGVNVRLVACADYFQEKADETGKEYGLEPEACHGGIEAYKQVMASDADIILLATAPLFRPVHFQAAVDAGKHVFMEKPVACDPVGCRQIIATGEQAKEKGLCVVAGTQRRHSPSYRGVAEVLRSGEAGTIRGGTVNWMQGQLWYKERKEGESDADYLIRNWVNWNEMCGDMIAEQHVHNIDVAIWFIGRVPESAVGFGARHRRITGNCYDFFSTDFDFGEGVHIHSKCRQIDDCANNVGEFFATDKGNVWGNRRIALNDGSTIAIPTYSDMIEKPYVQEHVSLQRAITGGSPINEARQVTESCLAAIMGRIAAYTGDRVTWEDVMENPNSKYYNLALAPTAMDFEKGSVTAPEEGVAPVPGA